MRFRNGILQTLTVFSSLSTVVCCALPALLVSVGAGAVVASVVSTVPQLVWLSKHKVTLFVFAGAMLAISGISAYRNHNAPCPTEPLRKKSCLRLRRISSAVLYFSLLVYVIGFLFAFIINHR